MTSLKHSLLALGLAFCATGCMTIHPSPTTGQVATLEVDLTTPDPASLGTPSNPVSDSQEATFDIIARDETGAVFSGPQNVSVNVYISFGGVKTGMITACGADAPDATPIATVPLVNGQALGVHVTLPQAFGPTAIWIDEPTWHAVGASPTIYFPNPRIADVQTPVDKTATNLTFCTAYNGKFVVVDHATGSGQLVVGSVFGDAFTITDTGVAPYDSTAQTGGFNNIYIFSFGKPPDYVEPGRLVSSFSGNISKFVGFTEVNFPLFTLANQACEVATDCTGGLPCYNGLCQINCTKDADCTSPGQHCSLGGECLNTPPAPVVVTEADVATQDAPHEYKLVALSSGLVTYTGPICDPTTTRGANSLSSWLKYSSFSMDNSGQCDSFIDFAVGLPSKQFGTFTPVGNDMKVITVTGMLQNGSGQNPVLDTNNQPVTCSTTQDCLNAPSAKGTCDPLDRICKKGVYNFWTIYPRTVDDIQFQ